MVTQLVKKSSIPSSLIVAIVLYGNPYFKAGAPQNACSAVSVHRTRFGTGRSNLSVCNFEFFTHKLKDIHVDFILLPRFDGVCYVLQKSGAGVASATGVQMPSQYASIVFDCCATGDMICQTAGTMVSHMSYPRSQHERSAVSFVKSKLQSVFAENVLPADSSTTDQTKTGS